MMTGPYIHLHIGNGKGKTTAAYGLALRAYGRGKKVKVISFLKSEKSGEDLAIEELGCEQFEVLQLESPHSFYYTLSSAQKTNLQKEIQYAFSKVFDIVRGGVCDLLVLDEIIDACNLELVVYDDLFALIDENESTEIVLTGRDPHPKLLDRADYISEFICVKHPYQNGVKARPGIEY